MGTVLVDDVLVEIQDMENSVSIEGLEDGARKRWVCAGVGRARRLDLWCILLSDTNLKSLVHVELTMSWLFRAVAFMAVLGKGLAREYVAREMGSMRMVEMRTILDR